MKKSIYLFFCLLSLIICSSSYSQTKNYTSADTEISASVGEQFTVTLSSNKTTGFSWSAGMIADNSQVVVTGIEYKVPDDAKTGQGGEEVWHFKSVAPGTAKIIMYYARLWESDKPSKEITYMVNIK